VLICQELLGIDKWGVLKKALSPAQWALTNLPSQLSSKEIDAVEETSDPSEDEAEGEYDDLDEETEHGIIRFFLV